MYGFMIAGGTGGTQGADFEGSEKLFYNPDAYNIYGVPNLYDRNADGSSKCGFFWPAYLNRAECYDKNGEPDVIKSLIELITERKKIAEKAKDPIAYTQKKAELPITPQDAVMRIDGTLFPVADIKDYLATIQPSFDKFISSHWVGDLIHDDSGEIKWKLNADLYPNRDYPVKDNKKEGAIEIFEMPIKDSTGKVPNGLYIAGIDPVDDDESQTNSMFSIFIMNLLTDRIVAEYTGRTFDASENFEKARKLLLFYNAKAMYENDKKGLYAHFMHKNCLHLLADNPEIAKDLDIVTTSYSGGNKAKGVNSSKKLNAWGRRLQVTWMMENAYKTNSEDPDLINLHKVRSIGYLKECTAWNPDGNFDRVSAMGMLMILRAERERFQLNLETPKDNISQNEFWDRGFKKQLNMITSDYFKDTSTTYDLKSW